MSTGNYIGVGNEAHSIVAGYVGVDNVARKIVKAYVGVDGKAKLCWKNDSKAYLEFTSPSSFTISCTKGWNGAIEYDNGSGWTTWTGSAIASGQIDNTHSIRLRGSGNTMIMDYYHSVYSPWTINGSNVSCSGNIENLLDYQKVLAGEHPTMNGYCYYKLFYNCTALVSAPELPATTLAAHCYDAIFSGCTSLTEAPALPATTLAEYCYYQMFFGCTALTTAPALPATTLAKWCYCQMFQGCTALTAIPALPATTLAEYCYFAMFQHCSVVKLSASRVSVYTKAYRIPETGTGTMGTSALDGMFQNTGGTFTGAPEINTTYYLSVTNSIV